MSFWCLMGLAWGCGFFVVGGIIGWLMYDKYRLRRKGSK